MQTQLTSLLEKEMDRKEFLKLVGAGFVSLIGLGTLSGAFTAGLNSSNGVKQGYGSSAYGGVPSAKIPSKT